MTVARLVHEIQQWMDVAAHAQAVQIPHALDEPLLILPSYSQGILCRRDPATASISGPSTLSVAAARSPSEHSARPSCSGCMRPSRTSSCSPRGLARTTSTSGSRTAGRRHPPRPSQAQQAIDVVVQAWEQAEAARRQAPVEPTQLHDANPWLRMTRWTEYLQDILPADLLCSVEAPDPDMADPVEQGVLILYYTVDQLARKSQRTVMYCGQAIRMEARAEARAAVAADIGVLRVHAAPAGVQKWAWLWQLVQHPEPQLELQDVDEALQPWLLERWDALVCAMAVLGRGVDGWRDADSYPPILSRVIKIARFFVVEKVLWLDPAAMQIVVMWQQKQTAVLWALQSADDELEDLDEGTPVHPVRSSPIIPRSEMSPVRPSRAQSQDYSPWAGRTFQDQLEWMVRRFLVRGSHGLMQTLLDWRMYGLRVHYNSTTPGYITWQGTDELLYKELRFTMGDFRGFIHGLVETTRELLDQLLRMMWPVDGQRWLIDCVWAEPMLQAQFIRTHRCHPPKIWAYFRQVVEFKEKLAVLTYICGGQPSRAPELLSIQHVNTDTNVRWNIYIDDGMVALVTAYYKGFYASNDAKIIHRYVPREIGELIIYYLWLSPAPCEPPSTQERALLWGPDPGTRPITDPDNEVAMDDEQWLGHIADLQAAHSSHVAGMVYGRGLMEQAGTTAHWQAMFRESSTDWHCFLGFALAQLEPPSVLGKRKRALWEDAGLALHAIQHGESPIVAVMPTGGGKSMLFMLPAYVEPSGTTVRRCQQLNISYVVWERRRPPDEASIVLVTPESAITPEYYSFLNRLRIVRRLDCIVIDECHVWTQLVFLTATLPPTLEQALFERIGHAREAVLVCCGPPDAWIDSEIVQAGIRWLIQTINWGKTVIYANVAVDRTGILARFVDGRRPIIAATSALGMGVDIPDIWLIIHVGTPRTLLDYAQESGRAGRDGQTSVAVIIQPAGWDEPAPWMADTPVPEIERMQQYIAALCRRQVLDQYLDGQQRAGCIADEAPCDQCRPIQIEDAIARMREREMAVKGHGADQASGRPISQPAGPQAGHHAGHQAGHHAGHHADPQAGQEAGHHAGYQAGHHAGQEAGQEAGYQAGPVETPPSRSRSELFASQASSLHRPWPSRPATPLSPWEPPQWA
ncbi:hypothetical protein KXV74_005446 [Aspergillus fumigatus]|nr:hypothetical protein KXV74_005446 [Aspergillus fumigatus]